MDLIAKVIELATSVVGLVAALVKAVSIARDSRTPVEKNRRR